MKHFNTLLINNYIKGNRNAELENNKEFMMAVIEKTRDKKFIDYCSDDVKNDFDFVMFLVNVFNGDMNFITQIFSNYLTYLNTYQFNGIIARNVSNMAIVNEMSLAIRKNKCIDNPEFKNFLSVIYSRLRVDIELVNKYDHDVSNDFGMGFFCFSDLFGLNIDILNYFAERMIKEILLNNNYLFRKRIFDRFQSVDKVEKLHLLCLDFLNDYDKDLVKYLVVEFEALERAFDGVIFDIIKNWDKYYDEYEVLKFNKILNRSHRIYLNGGDRIYLSEDEILVHLALKYDVLDQIGKYNVMDKKTIQSIIDSFDDNHVEDILIYCDTEKNVYDEIEEVYKKYLISKREIGYSLIKKN